MPALRSARGILAALVFLSIAPVCARAQVVINEVAAATRLSVLDDEEDRSDWVELYNTGDVTVPLSGFTLSDDPSEPAKWTLPDFSLAPQSHLLIWCSGKDRTVPVEGALASPKLLLSFQPSLTRSDATWHYLTQLPDDPRTIGNLLMRADFDDSIVLPLNGKRIFSENFPEGETVKFDSFAQGGAPRVRHRRAI